MSKFEDKTIDTSWIDEEDKLMNIGEENIKQEKLNKINIYFFYISKENNVENIIKDNIDFPDNIDDNKSNIIKSSQLLKIIQERKILFKDGVKIYFTLADILSFQVNLENETIQNYIDNFPKFDWINKEESDDDDSIEDDSIEDDNIEDDNIQDDNVEDDNVEDDNIKDDNIKDDNIESDTEENEEESQDESDNESNNTDATDISNTFAYIKEDLTELEFVYSDFLKKHSYFEDLRINPSIFVFHSLSALFFMFKERSPTTHTLPPLRSILKKYNKTHKSKITDNDNINNTDDNRNGSRKTQKNVSIVIPTYDNRIKTQNSTKKIISADVHDIQ